MITVCHPMDDLEVLFISAVLEAEGIPYLVVGSYFGALFPGIQIPIYNERIIRVPKEYLEEAISVIEDHRSVYTPTFENLTTHSKIRVVIEAIIFGWVFPAGKKRPSNKAPQPTPKSGAAEL